jgi:hemerythrin-like domain-containing protein
MKEDFFNLLHQEHEKVKTTMRQLHDMWQNDTSQRRDLVKELKHDLTTHMDGEEKFWYPELRRDRSSWMEALEAEEEHNTARHVFNKFEDTTDNERWMARLMVLQDLIDHHVKVEEDELFALTRRNFTEEQINRIYDDYQRERTRSRGLLERIMGTT